MTTSAITLADMGPRVDFITIADNKLSAGESTTITITFSEALNQSSFTLAEDLKIVDFIHLSPVASGSRGTLSDLHTTDGKIWTVTLTAPTTGDSTDSSLKVILHTLTDLAGNPGGNGNQDDGLVAGGAQVKRSLYAIDTTLPTLTSASYATGKTDAILKAGETATVRFVFSEEVTGFETNDITLSNATGGGRLSGLTLDDTTDPSRKTWTAILTAPTTGTGSTGNTLSVNLAGINDLAGNAGTGTATTTISYSVDMPPTLTSASISYAEGKTAGTPLKASEIATVRFVFSEEVKDFGIDDITLSNATGGGKLSDLALDTTTDPSRKTWTAILTAPTTGTGSTGNTLSVNLAGINDLTGNAGTGTATTTISYSVDMPPTLTSASISYAEGKTAGTPLKAGETASVRFIFSEEVKDFGIDDITLSNATGGGKLSDLALDNSDTSRKTWTATLTAPTTGTGSTDNTLSVNLAGINDLAGNAGTGTATTAIRYGVDTTPPTLGGIAINNTRLAAGQSTAVTITFSEAVSNVAAAVHADNGALGPFTGSTDGKTWSATLTPSAGVEAASNHITVDMARITDSAGNTGSGEQSSGNYAVDTRAPVLAGAAVDGNQLVLSYTEANSLDGAALAGNGGFTVTDGGGTAIGVTSVSVDPAGKTITLTLGPSVTSQDTVTVSYTKPATGNVVQDAAGNDAANFTGQAVTNNTPTPPVPVDPAVPVVPDADRDHVPNAEEDQTIGPNGEVGDGNGDGIQDSTQAAVGSISVTTSSSTNSSVTLVTGSQDGKVDPDSNVSITRLEQKEPPADLPRGLEMPIGLMQFQTTPASAGSSEKSSLYVDPALGSNGYWVQDHSGTWVNLASEPYGGKMVDEGGRQRLDFQITDGGQFDADGKADGIITAPGAVAHMPLSIVGQVPDTEHGGFWF